MKLEYSRPEKHGNYGDDLNEWIWERLLPGVLDDNPAVVLLGIGTILSRWFTDTLPPQSRKIVLGSGGGKAGGAPDLGPLWHVYGVRGPLTAAYSNLSPEQILTDPAMLLRDLPEFSSLGQRAGIGFMPHIWSLKHWNWEKTAHELGLEYIDPRADSKMTTRRIATLDGLITEAMHGAIVADAFRTPWAAVSISPNFESSKWCDWAGSLGMPMTFHHIPYVFRGASRNGIQIIKTGIKTALHRSGLQRRELTRYQSSQYEIDEMKVRLRKLIQNPPFQLSDDARLQQALARTYDAIGKLRDDISRGVFA
jgi:succinoglycan biosynthesis protein ExoV